MIRLISTRKLSTHSAALKAVAWPKPDYGPVEVQRSLLLNGLKVAAAKPLGSQVAACTIMYQAGSRYERDDYIGATHFIRTASCASSAAYSGYSKMRYLTLRGAALTCTSDRQSISYSLRCPVTDFSELKCYLQDTALRSSFKQWEIDDLKPMIRDDLHRISPAKRVIDLAQNACWAGPLTNSLYCEDARIDGMMGDLLTEYTTYNYKTDHCTIASIGVPFEETMKLAESIEFRREKPPPRDEVESEPRRGYELYDLGPNSDTWICAVVPGCGTRDTSKLIKYAIVAAACGTGNIQSGMHHMDRTPQLPLGLMAGDDVYTDYKAFNLSYRDTGVFGILAKTRSCSAWNVTVAASEFLANVGDLNFAQIDIGKKRLKVSLTLHEEDCVKVTEGLALQLANDVQIDSAKDSLAMVDAISNDEVVFAAQEISKNFKNMALAIVGDIGQVPHDKELMAGF